MINYLTPCLNRKVCELQYSNGSEPLAVLLHMMNRHLIIIIWLLQIDFQYKSRLIYSKIWNDCNLMSSFWLFNMRLASELEISVQQLMFWNNNLKKTTKLRSSELGTFGQCYGMLFTLFVLGQETASKTINRAFWNTLLTTMVNLSEL